MKKLTAEGLVTQEEKKYRVSDRFFALWIRKMQA
jgi:predicted transcriptional regulator